MSEELYLQFAPAIWPRLTKIPVSGENREAHGRRLKDKLEAVTIETEKPAPSSPAGVEADVKSALLNFATMSEQRTSALAEAKREAGTSNSKNCFVYSCSAKHAGTQVEAA